MKKFRFSQRRQQHIFKILHHLDTHLAPTDRTLLKMMGNEVPLPGLFRLIHAWHVITAQGIDSPSDRDADGLLPAEAAPHPTVRLLNNQLAKVLARCRALQRASQRPTPRDLAISGGELVDLVRRPPGTWVGELTTELLEWISHDPARNQRAPLYEKVREWIAQCKNL